MNWLFWLCANFWLIFVCSVCKIATTTVLRIFKNLSHKLIYIHEYLFDILVEIGNSVSNPTNLTNQSIGFIIGFAWRILIWVITFYAFVTYRQTYPYLSYPSVCVVWIWLCCWANLKNSLRNCYFLGAHYCYLLCIMNLSYAAIQPINFWDKVWEYLFLI